MMKSSFSQLIKSAVQFPLAPAEIILLFILNIKSTSCAVYLSSSFVKTIVIVAHLSFTSCAAYLSSSFVKIHNCHSEIKNVIKCYFKNGLIFTRIFALCFVNVVKIQQVFSFRLNPKSINQRATLYEKS